MRRTWTTQQENVAAGVDNHHRSLPTELLSIPNNKIFSLDIGDFLIAKRCHTTPLRTGTNNETPNIAALHKL